MAGEFKKRWNDQDRDWHVKGIYYILIPLFLWVVLLVFLALIAVNSSDELPDPNAITWSLTVLQIVLGLFATILAVVSVFGYWAVRGAAVAAAKREARLYLDEKAAELFDDVTKIRQQADTVARPDIPSGMDEGRVMSRATEESTDDG